jgi:predicted membrane-bound spermidine synthase
METVIYVTVGIIGSLIGSNVAFYVHLRKANRTIKVLMQDEPIFRSMQVKYSLGRKNA